MDPHRKAHLGYVLDGVCYGVFIGLWISLIIDHFHPAAPYWWPNVRDNILMVLLPWFGAVPGAIFRFWRSRRKPIQGDELKGAMN